ncbi:hypothetical protein [Georgenia deserti]|uniref:IstB-like ATP-binding protein domain-containing protein n=1 Tax=Georgenia deserti TaxID=2093781 RepID=A0ABW4L5E7_9MICO
MPVAADAAEGGLYRFVDAAYQKRSVAITSNLHPSAFDELMPKTLATATVDRLHRAHARAAIVMVIQDLHITIATAETGEILRELTLDTSRTYQHLETTKPEPSH